MTTMIERVARAIAKYQAGDEEDWRGFLPHARLAIAAMREPTEAMENAGYAVGYEEAPNSYYEAMIDAALAD